ncbi:MAG: MFS transporter [Solirubrobacteraceae bacterium]
MKSSSARLSLVVGAVVFLDTMFYSVITPLLPQLSHQLALSRLSAGIMTGGYALGTLVASLPGGILASRAGPRVAVTTGISLMIAATVGFGLLHSTVTLDLSRFVEGVGGACSWAGGVTWLVAATPADRRGAVMGRVLAMSTVGSILGPAVGALASVVGRPMLFSVIAVIEGLLLFPVLATREERESSQQPLTEVLGIVRRPAVAGAMWLMVLPAVISGMLNVLVPLRIHYLGGGAAMIGAAFLVGAVLETAVSPAAGRLSDSHGRATLLRGALIAMAAGFACFTLPGSVLSMALLVVALIAVLGAFWAPAMALVVDLADQYGMDQAHGAALINLAWAVGQIGGAVGGGAVATSVGDAVPTLAVTALCLLTLTRLRVRSAQRVS